MASNSLVKPVRDAINSSRKSSSQAIHKFPEDLGAHCMVMTFKDYSFDATRKGVAEIKHKHSIVLPLPANLSDTLTINAQNQNLGFAGAVVANNLKATTEAIDKFSSATATEMLNMGMNAFDAIRNLAGSAKPDMKNVATSLSDYSKFIGRNILDALPFNVGSGFDAAIGNAINPHTSVNFDGVALKQHTFNWTFAPKSQAESEKLRDIQLAIKRSILPRYQGIQAGQDIGNFNLSDVMSHALLKFPNLVDIFLLGIDQEYYYHFKPSMVTQFDMNFSGGSQSPAILKGGKPAVVSLTMSIMETSIHTAEDYELQ